MLSVPLLVRIDTTMLLDLSQNVTLIQTLSLLMISEGILTIWLGLERIRSHYDIRSKRKHSLFFLLPSSACIAAVIALTLVIIYHTTSINYSLLASSAVSRMQFFQVCGPAIIRFVLKDWAERFEFRMLLALIQIVTRSVRSADYESCFICRTSNRAVFCSNWTFRIVLRCVYHRRISF